MLRPLATLLALAISLPAAAPGKAKPEPAAANSKNQAAAKDAPKKPETKDAKGGDRARPDPRNVVKDRAAQTEFLRGPLTDIDLEIPEAEVEQLRKEPRQY